MLRTRARDGLCFVAYCNLVGGQDELLFDGLSVVIAPDGEVIARAASCAEELLICDIDPPAAVAARLRDTRLRRGRRHRRLEPALQIATGSARPLLEQRVASLPPTREDELWGALVLALRDYVHKNGFQRVVLGLSGGIDSALVAALAAESLGPSAGRGRLDADPLQRGRDPLRRPDRGRVASASTSASSRSRSCASRSARRCPRPAAWRPRTCRRASAAWC